MIALPHRVQNCRVCHRSQLVRRCTGHYPDLLRRDPQNLRHLAFGKFRNAKEQPCPAAQIPVLQSPPQYPGCLIYLRHPKYRKIRNQRDQRAAAGQKERRLGIRGQENGILAILPSQKHGLEQHPAQVFPMCPRNSDLLRLRCGRERRSIMGQHYLALPLGKLRIAGKKFPDHHPDARTVLFILQRINNDFSHRFSYTPCFSFLCAPDILHGTPIQNSIVPLCLQAVNKYRLFSL